MLNLDEKASLGLQIETGQAAKSLEDLTKKAAGLKKELKAMEKDGFKNTDEYKKLRKDLSDAEGSAKKLARQTDINKMSYSQLGKEIGRMDQELKKSITSENRSSKEIQAKQRALNSAIGVYGRMTREINSTRLAAEAMANKKSGFARIKEIAIGSFVGGGILGGVQALGGALLGLGKDIFATTSKFEKYEAVLTAALGGQKAAKASMKAIEQLAKETRFSVDELTESYVKYVNRGLFPSKKEMMKLADIAASQGKSFEQLTEAILDAGTGEFERLKEFGIRATKAGDQVTFAFKGVQKTVKNTPEAMQAALVSFGELNGVAGMNAKMMQTLDGKVSNLGDQFDAIKVVIGNGLKPVFMFFLDLLSKGLGLIQKVSANMDVMDGVFEMVMGNVRDFAGLFKTIFSSVFPNFSAGGLKVRDVMKYISLGVQTALVPGRAMIVLLKSMVDAFLALGNAGKGFVKFLTGDFAGAAKEFDTAKSRIVGIGTSAKTTFKQIGDGYYKAMVSDPKKVGDEAAELAGGNETKRQDVISKAQQKATEKRDKQRIKDTEKLDEQLKQLQAKFETETADTDIQATIKKIEARRDAEIRAVQKSTADAALKAEAIKKIDALAKAQMETATQKHLEKERELNQKALDVLARLRDEKEEAMAVGSVAKMEAKVNKLRQTELRAIALSKIDETQKGEAVKLINEKYDAEIAAKKIEIATKAADEAVKLADKEFKGKKLVLDQTQKAEMALGEWRLQTEGTTAKKRLELQKSNADLALAHLKQQLELELQAQEKHIELTITDETARAAALKKVRDEHLGKVLGAEADNAKKITDIEAKAANERKAKRQALSDGFKALFEGDLTTAIGHFSSLVAADEAAQDKRLKKASETANLVGGIAMQAVTFLNDLTQKKLAAEIDASKKETDAKVADLEKQKTTAIASADEQATKELAILMDKDATEAQIQAEADKRKEELTQLELEREQLAADEKLSMEERLDKEKRRLQDEMEAEKKRIAALELERETAGADRKYAIEQELNGLKQGLMDKEATSHTLLTGSKTQVEQVFARKRTNLENQVMSKKQSIMILEENKTKSSADRKAAVEKNLADRKTKIESSFAFDKGKIQADAQKKENDLKLRAWKAEQKAKIAMAAIQGAMAILSALATPPIFVGIAMAAIAGVATLLQVRKIRNEPPPVFGGGNYGFTPRGSKHESTYGTGGIALIDNKTGRNVGEMEGGEPIVNAEQGQINEPIIYEMFRNARRGEKRPVWETMGWMKDGKWRPPMVARNGGILGQYESDYWKREMYLFGSRKRRREREAAQQAESGGGGGDMEGQIAAGNAAASAGTTDSSGAQQEAMKTAKEQNETMAKILAELTKLTAVMVQGNDSIVSSTKETTGAANATAEAVRNSNNAGRLDALIGAISSFGRK